MSDHPQSLVPVDHVEPVPRRIRATLGGELVFDTLSALYVWEWQAYPQYYVPLADVNTDLLVDEQVSEPSSRGTTRRHGLRAGGAERPGAARVLGADALPRLVETVRFEWDALDAWFEEDEEVFVHPRSPYARVDAIRSTRSVAIEVDGTVVARSLSPVMVFETGLPTRYYLNQTEVDLDLLVPSDMVTACPYKGMTSRWWSVRVGDRTHPDVAWSYSFPTRQLQPIAGLIAFYNERVDIVLDGQRLERPMTVFSKGSEAS